MPRLPKTLLVATAVTVQAEKFHPGRCLQVARIRLVCIDMDLELARIICPDKHVLHHHRAVG